MRKLVLYDIDGTLMSTGGAGTRAMDLAFDDLFGIERAFEKIPMAGKTDIQIMKEGLGTYGIDGQNGYLDRMRDKYIYYLGREIDNPARHLKPGIMESIDKFRSMNVTLGLLTGNLEAGAKIKLGAFDLNGYFVDGAFGSDHEERNSLLPVAIDKFAKRGLEFVPEDCIVIGDTPRDVECAKIHNARCIAVATGPYSKAELLSTDADLVLNSLENQDAYMSIITG